jgi:hypothetical protein
MDNIHLDVTIKLHKHVCCHECMLKLVRENKAQNNSYIQDFDYRGLPHRRRTLGIYSQ